jgi:ribose transport system substrate-binding protein
MIRLRHSAAASCVLAAVVALGACSSNSTGGSGTSGAQSGVNAAATASSSGVKAAQAFVAKYTTSPTKISVTQPLPSKPGPGSIIYFGINAPSSVAIYTAVKQAASAVGWRASQVIYDPSNPASLQSAMRVALQDHPTAVVAAGVTPDQLGNTVLNAYGAAKIPIIFDAAAPVKTTDLRLVADGEKTARLQGEITGAWFVADSKGKGHALLEVLPVFTTFVAWADAFKSTVEKYCGSKCSVSILNVTSDERTAGQVPSLIVSELRNNPGINYVFAANGSHITGLNSAMAAAGVTGVKIGGVGAQPENYADLHNGTQSAWVPIDNNYNGYCLMDMALRITQHVNPGNECDPLLSVLLTKSNVGNANANNYTMMPDEFSQFKKLWHVSS